MAQQAPPSRRWVGRHERGKAVDEGRNPSNGQAVPTPPFAEIASSLTSPVRRECLRVLNGEPVLVKAIAKVLGIDDPSAVSNHLGTLYAAGLVVYNRVSDGVQYGLAPGVVKEPFGEGVRLGLASQEDIWLHVTYPDMVPIRSDDMVRAKAMHGRYPRIGF